MMSVLALVIALIALVTAIGSGILALLLPRERYEPGDPETIFRGSSLEDER